MYKVERMEQAQWRLQEFIWYIMPKIIGTKERRIITYVMAEFLLGFDFYKFHCIIIAILLTSRYTLDHRRCEGIRTI